MCKVFKIGKSSYYEWLGGSSSCQWQENNDLLLKIEKVYVMSHKSYGSPRIHMELKKDGIAASRQRIARIMKASGIKALAARRFVATTDSKHKYPVADNVLNRGFTVERKNQVWVSDITYIHTSKGWMYLTVIIDLYNRKIIGWAMSKDLTAQNTCIKAWRMAIKCNPLSEKLIFHSDRGVQFACTSFTNILKGNKLVVRSMSRKGNCWDNAVAESFFKSLKVECVYTNKYQSLEEAQVSVFEWIETWYNKRRRHSALNYMTINEFENQLNKQRAAA